MNGIILQLHFSLNVITQCVLHFVYPPKKGLKFSIKCYTQFTIKAFEAVDF